MTSFGDGYRYWERWDIDPDEIEDRMSGYVLQHTVGGVMSSAKKAIPKRLDDMLQSGGEATSTSSRIRKGVSIRATGGGSPQADQSSGGANYFYTRIKTTSSANKNHGIFFKNRLLARQDAVSYDRDRFGATSRIHMDQRVAGIETYKKNASKPKNETNFKHGLSILDDVEYIRVFNEGERQRIFDVLKKNKVDILPDGRKARDLVLITGEDYNTPKVKARIKANRERLKQ